MNIDTDKAYMVFKNEYEGKSFYKIGVSKKDQNGNWLKGNIPCQFKKLADVPNKTNIYIKNAWIDFYIKNGLTNWFIFISEFETVSEAIVNSKEAQASKEEKVDPTEILDSDLPF